jgi:hypothetical protein
VNASSLVVEEAQSNVGATVMGRNMFGGGPGPWNEDQPWNGWWGNDPPYHNPVFVLTHHPRRSLEMEGGTTFTFVTDGIGSVLEQAKQAAGELDVLLGGRQRRPAVPVRRAGRRVSSSTSSRSCSATASGCSTTWAASDSSRCVRSRRPVSPHPHQVPSFESRSAGGIAFSVLGASRACYAAPRRRSDAPTDPFSRAGVKRADAGAAHSPPRSSARVRRHPAGGAPSPR